MPRRLTTTTPVALGSSSRSTTRRVAPSEGETHVFHHEFHLNTRWLPLKCVYLMMCRAYVEKYLLEKSRLVYQEHNERCVRRNADVRLSVGVMSSCVMAYLDRYVDQVIGSISASLIRLGVLVKTHLSPSSPLVSANLYKMRRRTRPDD